jgi:hypothetical protein
MGFLANRAENGSFARRRLAMYTIPMKPVTSGKHLITRAKHYCRDGNATQLGVE